MEQNVIEKVQILGNNPLPRFGHTITHYSEGKVCLFGGATGTTGQFSITDNTYTLEINNRYWKKIETTGTSPSARAAHGAVCIQPYKIVIYGGATGSGGLASDDLYLLDLKDGVGQWKVINVTHKTPGKRYGHSLSYSEPFLIVFGGNVGEKSVNDCWIINIKVQPLVWTQIKCQGDNPQPRVYHSASLCTKGPASGMLVIFGGRGADNNPLGDNWGLRRHRDGRWDWLKAPERTKPSSRYQHSGLFIEHLMFIIGGRTNDVTQHLPLQIFDTQTSEWLFFSGVQRFRHGSVYFNKKIYIYGGFELQTPNLPTDSIAKISLQALLQSKPQLFYKICGYDKLDKPEGRSIQNDSSLKDETLQSRSTHSNSSTSSAKRVVRKKKFVMNEPILGNQKGKVHEPRKMLTAKQQIPEFFVNTLLLPSEYMNSEALRVNFKPEDIIRLCDLAEAIIKQQPMILQAKTPLKIFGDIHGQFTDLMSFFALYGTPHENGKKKDIENYDYIFLGDFVDRGSHSLETICLLLALKCIYPEQVHLIRGNHEDSQININFGFRDECADKLDEDPDDQSSAFNRINRLFEYLPLAAVIEDKILCLHGGIGGRFQKLHEITQIQRPLEVMHEVSNDQTQIVLDLLWSDPTESDSELGIHSNYLRDPQESGNIVKFGPDRVQSFLKANNLSMIIRAHECVMDGFQRFASGKLITVFSATDYCGKHKNAGAILIVKTNYEIVAKLIYPSNTNSNNWIQNQEQLMQRPPTPPRWRSQNH